MILDSIRTMIVFDIDKLKPTTLRDFAREIVFAVAQNTTLPIPRFIRFDYSRCGSLECRNTSKTKIHFRQISRLFRTIPCEIPCGIVKNCRPSEPRTMAFGWHDDGTNDKHK